MSNRLNEIDSAVLGSLSEEPTAILDLALRGFRFGTLRNSLKRLLDAGAVTRRWDGNARFGRYLYTRESAK